MQQPKVINLPFKYDIGDILRLLGCMNVANISYFNGFLEKIDQCEADYGSLVRKPRLLNSQKDINQQSIVKKLNIEASVNQYASGTRTIISNATPAARYQQPVLYYQSRHRTE